MDGNRKMIYAVETYIWLGLAPRVDVFPLWVEFIHASTDLAPFDRDCIPAVAHTVEDWIAENFCLLPEKWAKSLKDTILLVYTRIFTVASQRDLGHFA